MRKKTFLSAAVAASMVFTMFSVPALATDVTIVTDTSNNTPSTHTYNAYQIFSADVNADGVLTNVTWAEGVNSSALESALKESISDLFKEDETNIFSACTNATDFAEAMNKIQSDSDAAALLAQIIGRNLGTITQTSSNGKFTGLAEGYYFIKDADAITGNDASTMFILRVAGDANLVVPVKSSVPTLEKKVLEVGYTVSNTSTGAEEAAEYGTDYNDVADYSIGDLISFRLYGTVADNFRDYNDDYWYQFQDTIDTGLTFYDGDDADAIVDVTVYKKDASGTETEISDTYYEVSQTDQSFTVTFDNLKDIIDLTATDRIIVEYQASLNSSAVIGNDGNVNTAKLLFSNNPNVGGGTDTDGDGTPDETGETPEDQVVVLTYQLDVTKQDGDNTNPLQGVTFALKNSAGQWVVADGDNKVTGYTTIEEDRTKFTTDENGQFSVTGLEDGTYTLDELQTLNGYNDIADITLVIAATTSNGQSWAGAAPLTGLTINKDNGGATNGSVDTGIVAATVYNYKGSSLPSTGGMGTVAFYVVGITLMAGAGVLLVTKKRASAEE